MKIQRYQSILTRPSTLILLSCLTLSNLNAATLKVGMGSGRDSFKTIASAVAQMQPGDTLLIGDGVYRESIDLRTPNLKINRAALQTRVKAAPGAQPLIKGSDVVLGWQRAGKDVYSRRQWAHNSQQVFVNGAPLKQVGGILFGGFPRNARHPLAALHASQGGIWPARVEGDESNLGPESFYYDVERQTLYIRTAADVLGGAEVEASTRPYLLIGELVNNFEFTGLSFEHANTTAVSQSGAISLLGDRLRLDNVSVSRVDGTGIDVTGNDNEIRHSKANYCGTVGMKVRGRNVRMVGNETSFNNTRGFNKWWEAGGAKFVGAGGLKDSEIVNHRALANNGDGIWFDWRNDNNRVSGSVAAYNQGMGIHYEASHRAFLFDNLVIGNSQRGIYLPNSSNSIIARNVVVANQMEGIAIVDEREAVKRGLAELRPDSNRVVSNLIGWNAKAALILPADATDNRSEANIFASESAPQMALGWPSRERPLAVGLDKWRSISQQDRNSEWRQGPLPDAIGRQVDARALPTAQDQPWAALRNESNATRLAKPAWVEAVVAELAGGEKL